MLLVWDHTLRTLLWTATAMEQRSKSEYVEIFSSKKENVPGLKSLHHSPLSKVYFRF